MSRKKYSQHPTNYTEIDKDYFVIIPDRVIPPPKKEVATVTPPKKEVATVTLPKKVVPVVQEPKKVVPVVQEPKKVVPVVQEPKKVVPVVQEPKKVVPVVQEPKKVVPVVQEPKKVVPVVQEPKKVVPVVQEPKKVVPAISVNRKEIQLLTLPKKAMPVLEIPKKVEPYVPIAQRRIKQVTLIIQEPKKVVQEPKKVIEEPKKAVEQPKKAVEEPKKAVEQPKKTVEQPKKAVEEPKKVVEQPKKEINIPTLPSKGILELQHSKIEEPVVKAERKEIRPLTLPKQEIRVIQEEPTVEVERKQLQLPTFPKKQEPVVKVLKEEPVAKVERKEIRPLTLPKRQVPTEEEPVVKVERKEIHPLILPKRQEPVVKVQEEPIIEVERKQLQLPTFPKKQEPAVKIPKEEPIIEIDRGESSIIRRKVLTPISIPKHKTSITNEEDYTDDKTLLIKRTALRPITLPENPDQDCLVNMTTMTYDIPTRNDLAILLVFFDYIGSVRILMNYLFMREKLKLANIPVFTLELVMNGDSPKISDAIHVYGSSYLFQKEHLLRLLEKQIPEQFTKLVCLDADVLFDDPCWYDKLSTILDTSQVVQCFDTAYWLNITYTKIQKIANTCLKVPNGKRFYELHNRNFHPGYGWAFTREWYNTSGFFDLAVLGSGDTMFAYGALGYPIQSNYETRIYKNSYTAWKNGIVSPKCSFLPVGIYHLYHGPTAKRQYVSRYSYFEKYEQIEQCLAGTNADGVYELLYPELNLAMLEVFKTRDDDGID